MSKLRQRRDDAVIRTFGVTFSAGAVVPPQRFDWHQLIYASRGVMTVHTSEGSFVVPSHRAVWVPANVGYRIEMHGSVAVRALYVTRRASRSLPEGCCVVNVSPLLRELVLHAVAQGALLRAVPEHRRVAGVILDQLALLRTIPLQLPVPTEPRAAEVAEWLLANPGARTSMARVARRAGASRRTLERTFRVEVGMSLGRWRQRLRIMHALRLLAGGDPVTSVAEEVGYATPSAFIAMFKKELGTTPSRWAR